jgi:Ca2+:H+ antiporter
MQAARITVGAVLFPALALGLAGVFLFGERDSQIWRPSISFRRPLQRSC